MVWGPRLFRGDSEKSASGPGVLTFAAEPLRTAVRQLRRASSRATRHRAVTVHISFVDALGARGVGGSAGGTDRPSAGVHQREHTFSRLGGPSCSRLGPRNRQVPAGVLTPAGTTGLTSSGGGGAASTGFVFSQVRATVRPGGKRVRTVAWVTAGGSPPPRPRPPEDAEPAPTRHLFQGCGHSIGCGQPEKFEIRATGSLCTPWGLVDPHLWRTLWTTRASCGPFGAAAELSTGAPSCPRAPSTGAPHRSEASDLRFRAVVHTAHNPYYYGCSSLSKRKPQNQ
ncbi:hypothetical protein SAMN05444320_101630 [Streptoalloteichus hindustanus]|uniref:Uncharacterized protein n=1 Tax=Streptoalloteichus hindustanus TaxID=2017 RepID=A0A1M4V3T6_STRHI|nr:hypothetical protein SAMN05444320_101630 [Streptoalloteichus hindustanus]